MKKVTRLDFNRFLMRRGVFKEFYAEQKRQKGTLGETANFVSYNALPIKWMTGCRFCWADSKQGYAFWNTLNNLWKNFINAE